jgi:hypothetical protein
MDASAVLPSFLKRKQEPQCCRNTEIQPSKTVTWDRDIICIPHPEIQEPINTVAYVQLKYIHA